MNSAKRNTILKIFLDLVMTILYILLMFGQNLGGFFHEAAGIGVGVLFVIHVLLNKQMIKGLFRSLNSGEPKISRLLLAVLDILLTICMPIVIITGILIAKELFVIDTGAAWQPLFFVHNLLSYICLGIMAAHLLLHGKYLVGVIKKLPSAFFGEEMRSALCRFTAGAAAAVVLYASLSVYKGIADKAFLESSDEDKNGDLSLSIKTESVYEPKPETSEITTAAEKAPEGIYSSAPETVITEETETPPPTLDEYLSGLICSGCGKRCSLLRPRCGKGEMQAYRAEQEYNELYGN